MSDSYRDTFKASRREFLRASMFTAACAFARSPAFAQNETTPGTTQFYGAMRSLPPGAVLPSGWLQVFLTKQAAGLGSHLPEISWPFTEDYWGEELEGAYFTPEQEYEAWWPWEQKAYWLDGTMRLAVLLRDQTLLERTTHPLAYTFSHADRHGYLGPQLFQDPLGDYHRWPHTVFFRSVAAAYDADALPEGISKQQVTAALEKHYLSDQASYGKPKRNINNVEDMLWCYSKTGNPKLLALAEQAWAEYTKYADDPENADLGAMRVFGDTPINAHGETYAETSKQPAILYLHTGKREYLDFALADQRRMFDHHMLIDGAPSTSEWFSTTTSLDCHETCDIADHTWSWGYLLEATGDGVWGDRIERACFNAAPGVLKKDWRALQYFSCPNQFIATMDSDHNWPKFKEHGGSMMAFQPNPGQRTACCGGNVHRIFPNYVIRMWMTTPDHGVAAALYGPSTVKLPLGAQQQPVEIVQTTQYPFEEQVHFEVKCAGPVSFPFLLRIPAWCEQPRLTLNGKALPTPRVDKGFARLERVFQPGDKVSLTLPMHVSVTHWPQGGIGIEHGPLVYALPIEADWTSKVEPRYSTAEFPGWEARPKSAWNYGVAMHPASLNTQVAVHRTPAAMKAGEDPWSNPPIRLSVAARKLPTWALQENPENKTQKFTPPLPNADARHTAEAVETIELVPYGSTHLRLTIFPSIAEQA